jgi:hypothetical protein
VCQPDDPAIVLYTVVEPGLDQLHVCLAGHFPPGHRAARDGQQVERVGAAALYKRLRSMRTTSTIITMRTTVPIPIYIDYSFPGSV